MTCHSQLVGEGIEALGQLVQPLGVDRGAGSIQLALEGAVMLRSDRAAAVTVRPAPHIFEVGLALGKRLLQPGGAPHKPCGGPRSGEEVAH